MSGSIPPTHIMLIVPADPDRQSLVTHRASLFKWTRSSPPAWAPLLLPALFQRLVARFWRQSNTPVQYRGARKSLRTLGFGGHAPRPTFSSRSLALSTRSTHSVPRWRFGRQGPKEQPFNCWTREILNAPLTSPFKASSVSLGLGNSGRIDETTRECLSQACCEATTGYRLAELLEFSETDWSDDLRRLFGEQRHTFRSKMMQTAAPFANKYGMSGRVGPQGVLPPAGKAAAAARLCEDMINDENWELYYLHNRAGTAGNASDVALRRLRLDSDTMWGHNSHSPPRLFRNCFGLCPSPCSAWRGSGSSADASLRYSVEAYAPMEARVINGMNQVLEGSGTAAVSRHGLENMPFDLHRRGLELLSKTQTPRSPHFYIPSFEQLLSLTGAQPFTEAQGETQFLPRETQEVVGASVRGQALAFEATQGLAPYRDESKGALEGWVPAGFGDRSAAFHSFVELVRGLSPRELTPVLAPVSPRVKLWFALLMGSGGGEPSDAFERQRVLDKRRELWRYHCILVFQ
ncbi:hypothetical protein L210DRAFT_3509134 [Boletus edulis BED1]|uniref:Uncharacterized protein n=1 Tax=Boletus edulis BED1 TaxID=1328754 RepID=A0AAD4G843_BOLED|nr:hypothetical protein L210DRAFT_3509134 [Boletus edulis BED1]